MSKTVVFATDFSTDSEVALGFAVDIAKSRSAKLLIVHVAEPLYLSGSPELFYTLLGPDEEAMRGLLEKVRPADASVRCEHRLIVGPAAQSIVDLSEAEHAEMIVVGSHGRTGLGRVLMGSVAEAIVRRASCPVLVIKHPQLVRESRSQTCSAS